MIWQPEFTDKTLSRKTGAVHNYEFHSLCAPPIPEDALVSRWHAVDELQACARCGYCSHKY
ncbi:hypothetical protein AT483_24345, partial [Escherichia coli]